MTSAPPIPATRTARIRRWRTSSVALIVAFWAILQIGGLFTPGLLDDVDSIYIQIAREMLQRHDFVTPTIDGIRFFDKPPLIYWIAAGSMRLCGVHDWAARLPLALGVLALLLAVYALGIRFYSHGTQLSPSPQDQQDRAGLYAALAMATCLGPYIYTRFYIPDILIALWMTLAVHLFLIAVDRAKASPATTKPSPSAQDSVQDSSLLPMLGFATVTALNLLTKGLIGVVFPLAFALLYLAFTHQLKLLHKLQLIPSTLVFLAIAAPWHILAIIRNPPIPMPSGLGLPAHAGWAWFYLYNEHIARFLGHRIPHDYGQVPIPIFWLLLLLWLFPWVAFLPAALRDAYLTLRSPKPSTSLRFDSDADFSPSTITQLSPSAQDREAALSCLLWAGIILGFFTLSSRQEYYHLPALPALALLVGGFLATADASLRNQTPVARQALRAALYFLLPIGTLLFLLCGYLALTAHAPTPNTTLSDVLRSNPNLYNLSLGHLFDLTGPAMGFFRGPLLAVALGMLTLGPIAYLVRRGASRKQPNPFAANLLIALAMTAILLAAHEGLVRFYPILGSKDLALAIDRDLRPGDLLLNDGELTSGSALLFYTPQSAAPILLVNGRVNGPWFGSFYPDAPHIFLNDAQLSHLWAGPHRLFLLTNHPESRTRTLSPFGTVHTYATAGNKTILTNR
ncbi:MAG TPA: glycosyltransferase family 39 protein [Acidobacteriaceae bacterium]|nr:glycosyltransferase family 39 protein [Acidobacteriaceae bacterium]